MIKLQARHVAGLSKSTHILSSSSISLISLLSLFSVISPSFSANTKVLRGNKLAGEDEV